MPAIEIPRARSSSSLRADDCGTSFGNEDASCDLPRNVCRRGHGERFAPPPPLSGLLGLLGATVLWLLLAAPYGPSSRGAIVAIVIQVIRASAYQQQMIRPSPPPVGRWRSAVNERLSDERLRRPCTPRQPINEWNFGKSEKERVSLRGRTRVD